jgi:hypothetical protein
MTTTSDHEAFIRFEAAQYNSQDGVDTGLSRVIRNNLHHLYDSHGQYLVNWHKRVNTTVDNAVAFDISGPITDYRHCWTSSRRPIRLRNDGSPFLFRVQLAAFRISGAGTTTFRVAITTGNNKQRWYDDVISFGDNATDAACSSGTVAWLTLGTDILELSEDRLLQNGDAFAVVPTNDGASGAPGETRIAYVRMTVWATGVSGGVTGASCAEYCGGSP